MCSIYSAFARDHQPCSRIPSACICSSSIAHHRDYCQCRRLFSRSPGRPACARPVGEDVQIRCSPAPITPLDLPCRVVVSDTRSNQRPLYKHTAPEPLEDQCWWESESGQSASAKYTRANRRPPSALQAPTRLNSARYSSVFSAALPARVQNASLCPHEPLHRSTQAFCRSSKCCSGAVLG